MSDESTLAQEISGKPPWWASAPIWLAAGIVGVPSMMALLLGYYVADTVTKNLVELKKSNQVEMQKIDKISNMQEQYFELVRRHMAMQLEISLRACIHSSDTQKERDDCLKGIAR